jgi:hypothetical protein
MSFGLSVPGVYYTPVPRAPAVFVRTDVAGFVGFDPRVRDGSTPSQLLGLPPVGHSFQVDVAGIQVVIAGRRFTLPATTDFTLSHDETTIPMPSGHSIVYTLVATAAKGESSLAAFAGMQASTGHEHPPSDAVIAAQLPPDQPWLRIADITIERRTLLDLHVRPSVTLASYVRCDDFTDYVCAFGTPIEDGTFLGHAVRAYFANGGDRCWVAVVRRPDRSDPTDLDRARNGLIGIQGQNDVTATGFERLLLIDEVSFVDVPDLYARRVAVEPDTAPLPPVDTSACFQSCARLRPVTGAVASGRIQPLEPLYSTTQVFDAQSRIVRRCLVERWRVMVLLAVPLELDPSQGVYRGPSHPTAIAWRDQFIGLADDLQMSCAAFYHPWLLDQERVDATPVEVPPIGAVAGVFAKRDLARGPHVSPANETLTGIVGVTRPVDDAANALLYDDHINVIRPFPGYGIQVWGARTLTV